MHNSLRAILRGLPMRNHLLSVVLLFSLLVSLFSANHAASQEQRRSGFDPNKINEQQEGLENADWIGQADPTVRVEASGPTLEEFGTVEFNNNERPHDYVFRSLEGNDQARWDQLGMVAYGRLSATSLRVVLTDDDGLGFEQTLLDQSIDLANTLGIDKWDQWVPVSLEQGDYAINVSLWRSTTPVTTQQDQEAMGLTEVLMKDLAVDGAVASLVYKTNPDFSKAVLYVPGRSDSFAHPEILEMYEAFGYDFYSLDSRYCGRTRRFMNDTLFGHWIDDFDVYREETDQTMDFINKQKNYSKIISHSHSTGALMVLNYAMLVKAGGGDDPFDAHILNGPFMDWGHVGGSFNELLLENAGLLGMVGMNNLVGGGGISVWHLKNWILHRWNTAERSLVQAHLHGDWAQATTRVRDKFTHLDEPLTSSPVLLIASLGDDTLLASESETRMSFLSANCSTAILKHNAHDVTMSYTQPLNDDSIGEITAWLKTGATTGDFSDTTSAAAIFAVVRAYFCLGLLGWVLL